MTQAQATSSLPNWLFRAYQAALVVIVSIYALILVVLIPSGLLINTGEAIKLLGSLFFIYLAPGSFLLLFAIYFAARGIKPGLFFAIAAFIAAFWTIVAGYNVVLT